MTVNQRGSCFKLLFMVPWLCQKVLVQVCRIRQSADMVGSLRGMPSREPTATFTLGFFFMKVCMPLPQSHRVDRSPVQGDDLLSNLSYYIVLEHTMFIT